MSSTVDVDAKLLKMGADASLYAARPQTSIMKLIVPIHGELKSAQIMSITVRKGIMFLLMKEEMRKYNEELEKSGKCIWVDTI